MSDADEGFIARWARRKASAHPPPDGATETTAAEEAQPAPAPIPALSLADVRRLAPNADFRPFLARGVAVDVRRAALKKLFADPHFSVMDGLDSHVGDYSRADPLPPSVARRLVAERFMRRFDPAEPPDSPPTPRATPDDPNPDLQLQPDDAARADDDRGGSRVVLGSGDRS